MLTLQEIKQISHDTQNSINIEKNILKMLKPHVDELIQRFFKKHNHAFDSDVSPSILAEIEVIRKNILNVLDKKCTEIIHEFDNNYDNFILKHGWFTNIGAKTRHQITKDELAYELCEIIRKLYFVYMEEQFPKQYRTKTVEEYLLKDN